MAPTRQLVIKDEIRALEEKKARLHGEVEVLEKAVVEKQEAYGEVLKKLLAAQPDYKEIERERVIEIDSYARESVSLKGEIEVSDKSLKEKRDEHARLVAGIAQNTEKIKKTAEQLAGFVEERDRAKKDLNRVKSELEDAEKEKTAVISRLDSEIKQARETLRLVEGETKKKKAEIEREQRILGLKKHDLDIYAGRMQKKYPGEVFTLMDHPLERQPAGTE